MCMYACMYDTQGVMSYQHTWCSDVICLLKQLRPEVNSHSASFWTQVVLPANVLPRRHSLMGQGGSNGCPVQGWNTHTQQHLTHSTTRQTPANSSDKRWHEWYSRWVVWQCQTDAESRVQWYCCLLVVLWCWRRQVAATFPPSADHTHTHIHTNIETYTDSDDIGL